MFNGYIAEKRLQQTRRTEQIQRKETQIRKRYHTEIQPLLLEHYQKRLRNFIEKMTTNPIIINPQNLLPPIKEPPHFTFRDALDWKSIGPAYRQIQSKVKQRVGSCNERSQRVHTLNNKIYSAYKHQFRSRERNKQLQPAMRFRSVEKLRELKKKKTFSLQQAKDKQYKQLKSKGEHSNGIRETSNTVSNHSGNKNHEEDEIQFLAHREKNDIELEARLYEKQRQPKQRKLHFKKIADLALTQKNELQKKDLRQILRKSGYSKMKRRQFIELPQADNFSTLVQKISNR